MAFITIVSTTIVVFTFASDRDIIQISYFHAAHTQSNCPALHGKNILTQQQRRLSEERLICDCATRRSYSSMTTTICYARHHRPFLSKLGSNDKNGIGKTGGRNVDATRRGRPSPKGSTLLARYSPIIASVASVWD